jgi:hypothetical protein
MKIKQYFLVFAFVAVLIIALLYGISPQWFAQTFLGLAEIDLNITHIFRAVMCLYISLGLFWLFAAFCEKYRNVAVLTTIIFSGGLVVGRVISLIVDGQPSALLLLYVALELSLVPIAFWVWKRPD